MRLVSSVTPSPADNGADTVDCRPDKRRVSGRHLSILRIASAARAGKPALCLLPEVVSSSDEHDLLTKGSNAILWDESKNGRSVMSQSDD